MKIAIASDHAGFALKKSLKTYLQEKGHEVTDFGCHNIERCDYPDFAKLAAHAVSQKKVERGVLICGSGIGMCMTANRLEGVRAAVLRSFDDARLSREHNDANIACLGGRLTKESDAYSLLETFLETAFEGGRHISRIAKIDTKRTNK